MKLLTRSVEVRADKISVGDIVLNENIGMLSKYDSVTYPKEITEVFNIEGEMMVFHYEDGKRSQTNKCFASHVDTKMTIVRKVSDVLKKL